MAERKPYRRRADTTVTAVRLDLDGEGFTYRKWGAVQRGKPGDWLVDNGGEVYTVDAEVFAATYRPVAPGRFRKQGVVWAELAARAGTIETKEGSTAYRAGDYLVSNDRAGRDGWAVEAARFAELYEPAPGGGEEDAPPAAGGETVEAAVLWRRLDAPGHDAARLARAGAGWRIEGMAVFADAGRPCRLGYRVDCGDDWLTRRATAEGWIGGRRVEVEVAADEDARWTLGGRHVPAADGCLDLDLAFTPATNLLPIRRLALAAGAEAAAPAAWLTFPELALERLEQTYRRTGEATYEYAAHGGSFRRTLSVTPAGFVSLYPGSWELA